MGERDYGTMVLHSDDTTQRELGRAPVKRDGSKFSADVTVTAAGPFGQAVWWSVDGREVARWDRNSLWLGDLVVGQVSTLTVALDQHVSGMRVADGLKTSMIDAVADFATGGEPEPAGSWRDRPPLL